jgi:hypothetical protein
MTFCFWKIQTSEKDYLETETITKSRPKIETLIVARNKAKRLKQSLQWYCYNLCIFLSCFILFHDLDLTRSLPLSKWMV